MNPFRNRHINLAPVILGMPFIMFFWMVPFLSNWTIGNDYTVFPIQNQLELMFALKTGSVPLYVPGFAGGQSASALTLGQFYHPISHLAALMPGYWHGKALEWNTLLRLISLGIAHLFLYKLLCRIRLDNVFAFLIATVTVYNLRMLDLFRYGASLESWTGLIFLCTAIGWNFLEPKRRFGLLCIVVSTYWLVCSGHPQMVYYGLMAAGIFSLVLPYLIYELNPEKKREPANLFHFWGRVAVCCLLGILLSFSYLLPFYFDFIKLNDMRVAQNYQWADGYRDTLVGTLNNFFLPLRSDVHGAFGGSPLILVAALTPVLSLFRIRIPRVIWIVWGMAVIAFLHMQGGRTPVHYLVWKFMPLYSSFRVAGRISLIMPILIMLLLTWILNTNKQSVAIGGKRYALSPQVILAAVSLLAISIYMILADSATSVVSYHSALNIRKVPWKIENILLLLGVLTLLTLLLRGISLKAKFLAGILLCLLTCLNLTGYLKYGTWIEPKSDTPSFAQLKEEKRVRLDYRWYPGNGLANNVVMRQVRESCLEPLLGKVYCTFEFVKDTDKAYQYLAQGRAPDVAIIEDKRQEIDSTMKTYSSARPNRVRLAYASYNRLIFNVSAGCPGFFVFSYPNTGHWQAMVNQNDATVLRANGAAQAVALPAGESRVEFRYWSHAAFAGIVISLLMIVLIGTIASLHCHKNFKGLLLSFGIFAIALIIFSLWYHSIYNGDNLNTSYNWSSNFPTAGPNLAFGKRTYLISQDQKNGSPIDYGGLAVDGNLSPGSGFVSSLAINPFWIIDLHDACSIGNIAIFESRSGDKWNRRPLQVMTSIDRKNWSNVGSFSDEFSGKPLKLNIKEPQIARYLLIRATGVSELSLDEVEILPP